MENGKTSRCVQTKRILLIALCLHCKAPGEAEAELALMSQRGYIDAVWTDDADALVFGATKVIRKYVYQLYYSSQRNSAVH